MRGRKRTGLWLAVIVFMLLMRGHRSIYIDLCGRRIVWRRMGGDRLTGRRGPLLALLGWASHRLECFGFIPSVPLKWTGVPTSESERGAGVPAACYLIK